MKDLLTGKEIAPRVENKAIVKGITPTTTSSSSLGPNKAQDEKDMEMIKDKEEGYDLVLQKQALVYSNDKHSITSDVIKQVSKLK